MSTTLTHNHFLKQIHAEQDPAFAQGVYADWLEEQNDEKHQHASQVLRLALGVRRAIPVRKPFLRESNESLLLRKLESACIDTMEFPGQRWTKVIKWLLSAKVPRVERQVLRTFSDGSESRWYWWAERGE